jgi:hypothetical protein
MRQILRRVPDVLIVLAALASIGSFVLALVNLIQR